ncbi:MAG TPA: BTAD domain-containing putative transcriptional regulator [Streptosporangiaceae bacterium]|nr:BTAD domain-containing putative transcriptional regulator [Streptosporangiaceae bacterium]
MAGETQYGLLGSLSVRRDGIAVPVPPGQQRVLLAALLLRAGRAVSGDELALVLWGDAPLASVRLSLQNCVMRLRRSLGAGAAAVVTEPGGYRIDVAPDAVDVARFEAALDAGRAAARAGSWAEAARVLADGLALWRGEPLSGVGSDVLTERERPRLAELRVQALEARIEADLHLGRHADVIVEVRALAAADPLRERLHALLMTALYRDGQQAGALAAYRAARQVLIEELGAEPGPELQRLHGQILAGGPVLAGAAGGAAGPAERSPAEERYSLPPDTAAFTGRDAEVAAITAAVTAGHGGVVAIRAIDGMPGVGKTTLAVRAAHLLRDRFPDRQLFIDLRGHTPGQDPLAPEDALAGLLAATGVDPRYLPADLPGRAALWRDRMAGQRAVLVLDNAASSAQAAPLLPGGDQCLVLVTSRRHLADLPGAVTPLLVQTLRPEQARAMFVRLAPRAEASRAGELAELAELAGFLPLAISLLARVYNRHAAWSLADLAAETRASLLTLAAETDSVAAAFEVSYQHLDPDQRQFFRRLGLHPGTTTDTYAAAALAGVSPAEAARLLDGLHGEGLLTETGYRRYGMHDLIRRYAAERAAADPAAERDRAVGALLDYYEQAAAAAQAQLGRHAPVLPAPPGSSPPAPARSIPAAAAPVLADSVAALAWARAERASLLACVDYASRAGDRARLAGLTAGLAALLHHDGPWAEAITRHGAAAAAAGQLGDRTAQAGALREQGNLRRLTGDFAGAAADVDAAMASYCEAGSRLGRAAALNDRGAIRLSAGDLPAATADLAASLASFRDLADRRGEASAQHDLGAALLASGDYPAGMAALTQAQAIFRSLGDQLGQASALFYLGDARRVTGDYPAATETLAQALAMFRELGIRRGQASALGNLGAVRQLTGEYPQAARDLEEALGIFHDLGNHVGQAFTLIHVGAVRRLTGDYPGAAGALRQALSISRTVGSQYCQGTALMELAAVRRLAGDLAEAGRVLEEARVILADFGDPGTEAEALNESGLLHRARGELGPAADYHRQALELARGIGSPRDEATALAGLARCELAAGNLAADELAAAVAGLRQARELFGRLGAPEADDIAAELDALRPAEQAPRP